jgi:DNA primase
MSQFYRAIKQVHDLFCFHFANETKPLIYSTQTLLHCPNKQCQTNKLGHHSYGKDKLSISYDLLLYHCWVCHFAGSCQYLVNQYFSATEKEKFDKAKTVIVAERPTITTDYKQSSQHTFQLEGAIPLINSEFTFDHLNILQQSALNYLLSRGINLQQIQFYKILYAQEGKLQNCIVIPSFDANMQMNFYVAKNLSTQKYKNAYFKKTEIIFNEHLIDWKKPLILVEGPFDYLITHGYNRTAIFGTALSKQSLLFKKIITNKTPIILLLDSDALEQALRIAKLLINNNIPVSIGTLLLQQKNIHDPGELDFTLDSNSHFMDEIFQLPMYKSNSELLRFKFNLLK